MSGLWLERDRSLIREGEFLNNLPDYFNYGMIADRLRESIREREVPGIETPLPKPEIVVFAGTWPSQAWRLTPEATRPVTRLQTDIPSGRLIIAPR
jgi:hypothetical protein